MNNRSFSWSGLAVIVLFMLGVIVLTFFAIRSDKIAIPDFLAKNTPTPTLTPTSEPLTEFLSIERYREIEVLMEDAVSGKLDITDIRIRGSREGSFLQMYMMFTDRFDGEYTEEEGIAADVITDNVITQYDIVSVEYFWWEFDDNGKPQYTFTSYCNVMVGCLQLDMAGEVEEQHLRFLNESATQ